MSKSNPLNNAIFQDVSKARAWLESLLWAGGRVAATAARWRLPAPLKGRDGYYQCKACRKQFTVMVGTVFERSHIPLNKWLQAAFNLAASKKGISARQMSRMLGVTYKSTRFMCHHLRRAMKGLAISRRRAARATVSAPQTPPKHRAQIRAWAMGGLLGGGLGHGG